MTDGSLIPITDEQAKLGQEIVRALGGVGGYIKDILGDFPKDLFGGLFGDRTTVWRMRRAAETLQKANTYLEEQGITEPIHLNLKLAIPILLGAADENREELQDLWARLLAATMNPGKSRHVRLGFAEALQKLDPLDAKVMGYLYEHKENAAHVGNEVLARSLSATPDELLVSVDNLVKVRFLTQPDKMNNMALRLTPFAREFLRAVSDQSA